MRRTLGMIYFAVAVMMIASLLCAVPAVAEYEEEDELPPVGSYEGDNYDGTEDCGIHTIFPNHGQESQDDATATIASTCTHLSLVERDIGDRGAIALAEALKDATNLQDIDLRNTKIGDRGVIAIAEALTGNTALMATLTSIYLSGNNNIGAEGASALAQVLKASTAITLLHLDGCNIGARGATAIADAIKAMKGTTALTDLDLQENKIGDIGAIAIAGALESNPPLRMLYLLENGIGDRGAAAIAEGLKVNNKLQTLYLGANAIGDSGLTALAGALTNSISDLQNLHLNNNKIGDRGAIAMAEALKGKFHNEGGPWHNTALRVLNLDMNKVGASGSTAFAEALKVNTATNHVSLFSMHYFLSASVEASLEASMAENLDPTKRALKESETRDPSLRMARLAKEAADIEAREAEVRAYNSAAAKRAREEAAAEAAARAAAIDAHRQAFIKTPCGAYSGCEQLLGEPGVAQIIAKLDPTTLYDLGFTSVLDFLAYGHNNNPPAPAAEDGGDGHAYEFATADGGFTSAKDAEFNALVEPLKVVQRRKWKAVLAEYSSRADVLAAIFDNRHHGDTDLNAVKQLPILKWIEQLGMPAAAAAELEELGVSVVDDVGYLEWAELKPVAQKLVEISFKDAWWFEHGMSYTLSFLRSATRTTTTHGSSEL